MGHPGVGGRSEWRGESPLEGPLRDPHGVGRRQEAQDVPGVSSLRG